MRVLREGRERGKRRFIIESLQYAHKCRASARSTAWSSCVNWALLASVNEGIAIAARPVQMNAPCPFLWVAVFII